MGTYTAARSGIVALFETSGDMVIPDMDKFVRVRARSEVTGSYRSLTNTNMLTTQRWTRVYIVQ